MALAARMLDKFSFSSLASVARESIHHPSAEEHISSE
jgi:hypothetical protein